MRSDIYELISQGLRYWFVLLGFAILWRAFSWFMQDRRAYRKMLRALPDAGLVGEVVDLATGASQALPREGVIGSGKGCDIRLSGIRSRECEYAFVDGKGIELIPARRSHELVLDGDPVQGRAFAAHGSRLELPGYSLRFRLFAGLNVPVRSREVYSQEAHPAIFSGDQFGAELADEGMPMPDQMPGLDMPAMILPQSDYQMGNAPMAGENRALPELDGQYAQAQQNGYASHAARIPVPHQAWNPDMTWQYAVPPPEAFQGNGTQQSVSQPAQPVWEQEQDRTQHPRRRRSQRHES